VKNMDKRGSLWPYKGLIILLALVLIVYGIAAILCSIEQNTFRVPEEGLIAGLLGLPL